MHPPIHESHTISYPTNQSTNHPPTHPPNQPTNQLTAHPPTHPPTHPNSQYDNITFREWATLKQVDEAFYDIVLQVRTSSHPPT